MQILKNLCERGLEIKKTKDIRSYTKLIPCLKEYPNNPVITCDDDIIYPIDTIEWLYKAYKNDSKKIYFRRGHRMRLESEKKFIPYNNFDWEIQDDRIDIFNFPTGVGGVLYPPNCFTDEVFNEKKFMSLAPFADDVWFKAMALLKGTLSQKVWTGNPCYIELDMLHENTKERLSGKNVKQSKNDGQIKAVWDEYNLWEK